MKILNLSKAAGMTFAGVISLGLGGCVIAPAHHHPYAAYPSGGVVVGVAPPPDRVEVVGVAPFPGAIWISGNWVWRDHWVWERGYWARPPRHGARWERGRWERHHEHEWRWRPGRWDD